MYPSFEVKNGIAALDPPEAVFERSDLLWNLLWWVNRIWSAQRAKMKIDIQFRSKTTILFRIENEATLPLVVNVWTLETAASPPDMSVMLLWVDLKSVPSYLFSHKGLKCISSPVGKFVKLHPFTERCTFLDVASLLLEVILHEPLVEKVTFAGRDGAKMEVEVRFPWLSYRCNVCSDGAEGSQGVSESPPKSSDVVIEVENAQTVSPVRALLAELEAFPVPSRKLDEGTENLTVGAKNEKYVVGKECVVEGEKEECGKNEEKMEQWKEIPHRSHPSLDAPEVSKVSFAMRGFEGAFDKGTVSPSRFQVLESLSEEAELDDMTSFFSWNMQGFNLPHKQTIVKDWVQEKVERRSLWEDIRGTRAAYTHLSLPWILLGDYNVTLSFEEHSQSRDYMVDQAGMRDFQDLVVGCTLIDLTFVGSVYTWWNKRGLDPVGKKLDLALINGKWLQSFPSSYAKFDAGAYQIMLAVLFP
ncbi:hypothetical protein N665_0004s0001 [Sinapis alba]|nr:hypothetical protein N665_0004s0001 [Sinapis alba]